RAVRERRVPRWDGVRAVLADSVWAVWTERVDRTGGAAGAGAAGGGGPAPEVLRGAAEQLLASLDEVSDALRP
ncbi:hypothetical protein EF904_08185, partial [Streptomyces sp. WAC05950]